MNNDVKSTADVENIISTTFLQRVPDLMAQGHDLADALDVAFNQDIDIFNELQDGVTPRAIAIREELFDRACRLLGAEV